MSDKIEILLGPATETLPTLQPTFDFVFIDADKTSNAFYFKEARRLTKKGAVMVCDLLYHHLEPTLMNCVLQIVDNTVRRGTVADLDNNDENVLGVRKLLQAIKDDDGVEATTISTVGEKGFDGFTYITVL